MTDYITLFKQSDFDKLTIKVMDRGVVPSQHPFFQKHQCFKEKIKDIDMNILIKYIVLFYDSNSPLHDKFHDHIERKKAAAAIAGWKADAKYKFPLAVQSVMYCNNRESNVCILEYLRSLNNDSWAVICTSREALYRVQEDLMSDATSTSDKGTTKTSVDIAKTRAELASKTEEMADRLNKRMLEFLSNDASPYLRKDLFDLIDTTRKFAKITPERQAFDN